MQTRRLGRTNHQSSIVILGTAAFWDVSQAQANESMQLALDGGVNHIDVAPQYGLAEERVGNWLPPHRDQFFLGCKTLERGKEGAWKELHVSLDKLQTDTLNLYQLHAIGTMDELDKAFAKGGAIETLARAKDEGITQYLGITGHGIDTPYVHLEALRRFDFDTIMFPIHPRLYADAQYRSATEELLAYTQEKDVGVMVIKSITKGPWGNDQQAYTTWYRPFDEQARIQESVNFVLSLPNVTGIPSAGDTRLLPMVITAGNNFQPMSETEREQVIQESANLEPLFT